MYIIDKMSLHIYKNCLVIKVTAHKDFDQSSGILLVSTNLKPLISALKNLAIDMAIM